MNVAQLEKDHPWWKWLFGQPAYIILLFAILGAIFYVGYYGVPALVTQIQTGYETLDKRHAEERKEMREDAKMDRVQFQQAIEKNTQAIERLSEASK